MGASCGTELRLEGGSIKEERDAPAPPGTTIEVADLFYNTPARKKFLKSPATEFGHICQIVQRLALGFPNIHFRLVHNGGSAMEFPPARSARERIQQVYGLSLVERCVDVADEDEGLRLEGVSSRPLDSGLSRTPQEILVNQRWIKCPALAHAVYEAYGTYLAKGKHPRFVLHLTIDPRALDMNVHPAKREVRFSNQESLHEAVRRRIRDAISSQSSVSVSNIIGFSTEDEGMRFSERSLHPPTQASAKTESFSHGHPRQTRSLVPKMVWRRPCSPIFPRSRRMFSHWGRLRSATLSLRSAVNYRLSISTPRMSGCCLSD